MCVGMRVYKYMYTYTHENIEPLLNNIQKLTTALTGCVLNPNKLHSHNPYIIHRNISLDSYACGHSSVKSTFF